MSDKPMFSTAVGNFWRNPDGTWEGQRNRSGSTRFLMDGGTSAWMEAVYQAGVKDSRAEVMRLKQVLVEAAIPLEVLNHGEHIPTIGPKLYQAIDKAVADIREAITGQRAEP